MWALIAIVGVAIVASFWSEGCRSERRSEGAPASLGTDGGRDVVTAGRAVELRTEIQGDLAAAGREVTVAAPVAGYVMAAGSEVAIVGAVGNDLWAAGRTVSVGASVADNAWLAGRSVLLEPRAQVGGHARLVGESVDVQGPVRRDLKVGAARLVLASEVGGSVQASAGSVKVLPGAVIRGDLVVSCPTAPEISGDARVHGQVIHRRDPADRGGRPLHWLRWWLCVFLAVFILGAVAIAASPRWTERVADHLAARPGPAVLAGILALIAVPHRAMTASKPASA